MGGLGRDRQLKNLQERLEPYVKAIVGEQISSSEKPELFTIERVDQMAYALTRFVIQSTEKYAKGQIEHGSNAVDGLEDRDLQGEMSQEIQDMFWYNTAQLWKK